MIDNSHIEDPHVRAKFDQVDYRIGTGHKRIDKLEQLNETVANAVNEIRISLAPMQEYYKDKKREDGQIRVWMICQSIALVGFLTFTVIKGM